MASLGEIRELDDRELMMRLHDVVQELVAVNFRKATGQLDNTAQIGLVKRELAQLKTVIREREIQQDLPKGSLAAKVGSLRDELGPGYAKIRERFGKTSV